MAPPTFTLVDDADGKFVIEGNTVKVAAPLDYETATSHTIIVAVSGVSSATANQTFTINVADVEDDPVIVLSNNTLAENAVAGTVIGELSVSGGSGSYAFTITSDPDDMFSLDPDDLDGTGEVDYEVATSHQVTIVADNGIETITQTLTINVLDIDESTTAVTVLGLAYINQLANRQWMTAHGNYLNEAI